MKLVVWVGFVYVKQQTLSIGGWNNLKTVYIKPQSFKYMSKRTYQPSKKKRATTHGFLARKNSTKGSNVLQARRRKGRARLAVQPLKSK